MNLLEKGADIPSVQDIQQHDAGNTQAHVEHCLYAVLHCHVVSLISAWQAELTPYNRTLTEGTLQGRRHRRHRRIKQQLQRMRVDYRNKPAGFKGKEFKIEGRPSKLARPNFLIWIEHNIIID